MQRDGQMISAWQETVLPLINSSSDFPTTPVDVVIVGGGITGISTGLSLQRAGKKVVIVEAKNIGFGTTGGTTAHLNNLMDTTYDVMEKRFGKQGAEVAAGAIKDALAFIRQNVNELQIDCSYREADAILFAANEQEVQQLDTLADAAGRYGIMGINTDELPVPFPYVKALQFEGQACFHPLRYLHALATAFLNAGGVLFENCRVIAVNEGNDRHEVVTPRGVVHTTHVIYATHIPPGVNLLHFRCAPYRSYAMAVTLKDETQYPESLIYDLQDPYHYYRTQEIDGKLLLIAGGEDHKTGHEENTDGCFRNLEAHLRHFFDIDEVLYRWSSQYFEPVDGLPYIGHLPGHPGTMFVATGFGGNGMVYSAVAARVLTDMILGNENEAIELFDPNRIKMIAGFANFVKEAADVVGHLAEKLIVPADKIKELATLAPGEAAIVKYEGKKMAIYKDEQGVINAVNAACTHIKCDISWNQAEKTWDCPCHGSRFSYTGEMLTGPARRDLEKIDLVALVEKE